MPKFRKPLLMLVAALCVTAAGRVQVSLNHDRDALGLTRTEVLENAPPVLAFTTVALGGFRGLISNLLWIRATKLQDEGKYFEMAQLADWITDLEPGYAHVWVEQAWNMTYNISVKFKDNPPGDFSDRWRWVKAGIELLRDRGLKYNPTEPMIYRELSWDFQHKIGDNLDDGNMYYKTEWAKEMAAVFGNTNRPDFDALIHPKTPEERERANLLTNRYKMDPKFVKEVDEKYGPLDWRMPQSHAIYWAALGMKRAAEAPKRFKKDDLDQLRRSIYQSMLRSFQQGRLISYGGSKLYRFAPNLDIIPNVNATYERLLAENPKIREGIATGHRNFLAEAAYKLYTYGRQKEAQKWYDYMAKEYPNKVLLDNDTNSFPRNLTLEDFAVDRMQEELGDTSQRDMAAVVAGLIQRAFLNLVWDEDDRAEGLMNLAQAALQRYKASTDDTGERIALPSFKDFRQQVLNRLLDPKTGLAPEPAAHLRFKLNLPPPSTKPPENSTNAPAAKTG